MAKFRRYLTSLLLAGLCLAKLSAAGEQAEAASTFKAVLIATEHGYIGDLLYDCGDRKIKLMINSRQMSRSYPVPGDGAISLYRELPPVPPSEAPTRQPVASLKLNTGADSVVFFTEVRPAGGDGLPDIRATAFDASPNQWPSGSIQVFNFARKDLMLQFDGRPLEFKAGQSRKLNYPDATSRYLRIKCAIMRENDWSLELNRQVTIVPENTRALWLIFDEPGTREHPAPRLTLRNFIDPVPPPSVP